MRFFQGQNGQACPFSAYYYSKMRLRCQGQQRAAERHAHRTPFATRSYLPANAKPYGVHGPCGTFRTAVVCLASAQHGPTNGGPTDLPESSQAAASSANAGFLAALKDDKLAELVIGGQMGLGTVGVGSVAGLPCSPACSCDQPELLAVLPCT